MSYTIEQLAPGSFDVLLCGIVIAGLVRCVDGQSTSDEWQLELLAEMPPSKRPAPFTALSHTFPSRSAALEWLGIHGRGKDAEGLYRERVAP